MNKVTRKIQKMLKEWDKLGFSPMAINTGCCEEFAKELEATFHKKTNGHLTGIAMWGDEYSELFITDVSPDGHCFFEYEGKFYDSESPWGEKHPDFLKYYQRILNLTEEWQPVEYA